SVMLAFGVLASATPGATSMLTAPSGLGDGTAHTTLDVDAIDTTRAPDTPETPHVPTWKVSAADDLWSIAEEALGDGSLVDQILDLNPGVSARSLSEGMVLDLPETARTPVSRRSESDSVRLRQADPSTTTLEVSVPSQTSDVSFEFDLEKSANARYVVQEGDGMWNVAEALLGDGSRHVEMTDIAIGQEVAPGVVFQADTFVIHPGWTFDLSGSTADVPTSDVPLGHITDADGVDKPASDDDPTPVHGIPVTHVVVEGDTLSEIAEDHLGDQDSWDLVWAENAGADMGDGRIFDDPNLILPGWEIEMPAPEDAPTTPRDRAVIDDLPELTTLDERAVEQGTGDEASDGSTDADVPAGPDADAPTPPPSEPASTPPISTSASTPTSVPSTSVPAPTGAGEQGDSSGWSEPAPQAPAPIRLEHAALLAAGVLTLVGVRRRRALRAALPHARVPTPAPEIASTERRLRTIDSGERAARVDIAVRAIAHRIAGTATQVGTIRIAPDGELIARLNGDARLEAPWIGTQDVGARRTWTLPASVPIEMVSDDARQAGQPCLALVTVGIDTDGRDVLLDLEAAGVTAIEASPGQGDDVVRAIGSGLATSLSSEVVHLLVAKLGTDVLFDHPNTRHLERSADAVDVAARTVGSTLANDRSAFDLRARRTGGEMWEPAIVLLAHADDAASTLPVLPAVGHGVAAVAAVDPGAFGDVHGANTAGAVIQAHADGWRLVAFDESIALTPIGLSNDDVAEIAAILDDASTQIEVAPPVHVDIDVD
ncbi:MAG: LysM domain-containing protein, partial [Ilumatobacter sp.]|uniref:LysM peptidoglycan-binding domain-containing protein n=1 Tax=Ilumatobacter sp. TaxID=1967498 RepID=UPI003C744201